MATTISTTAACKHCGATVFIEKHNVTATTSMIGGVVSTPCRKCHKTSSYTYEIRNGQFKDLR